MEFWHFHLPRYEQYAYINVLKFPNHTKHVIENGRHFKVAVHKEWKCVSSKGSKS